MNQTQQAQWTEAKWAIIGKLIAEHATSIEDEELERILLPCVGGKMLTPVAKAARDAGVFTFADVENF